MRGLLSIRRREGERFRRGAYGLARRVDGFDVQGSAAKACRITHRHSTAGAGQARRIRHRAIRFGGEIDGIGCGVRGRGPDNGNVLGRRPFVDP